MNLLDAAILGTIQGLTEFLPVSSSGHLVIAQSLLGVNDPGITFEILVHLGTLVSVIIFFRHQLWLLIKSLFDRTAEREHRLIWYLILGTIPAVFAGLAFKAVFEETFSDPRQTSFELIATGMILFIPRFVKLGEKTVSSWSAFWIGIGQAISILPGISRSGTTIVAGMVAKVKPTEAAEFSFLLSIPAIMGAIVLEAGNISSIGSALILPYVLATVMSFALGLAAVYAVLATIKRGKFEYFAYYCFALGALGLYLFR